MSRGRRAGAGRVAPAAPVPGTAAVAAPMPGPRVATGTLVAAAAVAVATFCAYLPALGNGFINWDDRDYVTANPHLRSGGLELLRWAFSSFHAANWHPLTWLSHALDLALWGLDPFGHHLTSVLLHAANTFLVVVLAVALVRAAGAAAVPPGALLRSDPRRQFAAAALAGLLFGLHPLHVESVAWVAERKDLLCALFTLLGLVTWTGGSAAGPLRFADRRSLGAFGWFALALLAKPMAVTLPLTLLLLDWYPLARVRDAASLRQAAAAKAPFFALSAASSAVTLLAQGAGGALTLTAAVPPGTRLLVAGRALAGYLAQMALPADLSPYHPYPAPGTAASPATLAAWAFVLCATFLCLRQARRRPWLLAAWAWYVVTLLPVVGIVQVGSQAMADRYTYLPSLGPFVVAAACIANLSSPASPPWRALAPALVAGAALAASLGWATVSQVAIWRDTFTFWDQVIRREPAPIAFARVNRGAALLELGRYGEALADLRRAAELDPRDPLAPANEGIALERLGKPAEALAALDRALALQPGLPQVWNDRGSLLAELGRQGEAIASFDAAVARDPGFAQAWYNRGVALGEAGRSEESAASLDRALAIEPRNAEALVSRGVSRAVLGRLDGALADFDAALRLEPGNGPALLNRGTLLRLRGDLAGARRDFERGCAAGSEQACAALRLPAPGAVRRPAP